MVARVSVTCIRPLLILNVFVTNAGKIYNFFILPQSQSIWAHERSLQFFAYFSA